jgi:D-alanyl-D-alanine carboxypeptidase
MKKVLLIIIIFSFFPIFYSERVSAQDEANFSKENKKLEITSQSFLVVNLSDNSILLEKNKDQPKIPASLVKLMNALVVMENLNQNEIITLTSKMLSQRGESPALFPTLRISVENLLKASLIQSSNDAAFALTFSLPKGKFLKLMNEKAKKIGMKRTIFYDTTGLSLSNRSTAEDIVKLLSYIYQNHPRILEITKNDNFWLPGPDGKLRKFKNMNYFYQDPKFVGGKSGYLRKAGQNFASIFILNLKNKKKENQPIAIVILSSKDIYSDIIQIIDWLESEK